MHNKKLHNNILMYRGKQYWYQGSGAVLKVPGGWIIEDDSRWKELNGNAVMKTERIKDGLRGSRMDFASLSFGKGKHPA